MNHVFSSIVCLVSKEKDSQNFLLENIELARVWGSKLAIVFCGKWNNIEKELLHKDLIDQQLDSQILNFKANPTADEVLDLLILCEADLLVLQGDDQSELGRYYNQSLMRKLIRAMDCSVLIKKGTQVQPIYENLVLNGFEHPKLASTGVKAQKIGTSLKVKSMLIMNQRSGSKSPMDYGVNTQTENNNFTIELKEMDNNGFKISQLVRSRNANLLIMNSPDTKLGFEGRYFSDELDFLLADLPSDILLVHSTKMKS